MTKAIAYIRVSTDKQADKGHSLEAQQEKIEAYAKLYDLELIDTVIEAKSAKDLNREGLKGALQALKEGKAEALIVVKLDRLTRSVADLGKLIENHFTKAALLSVSEQIDTRSPSGRLVLNILASVSQWEREEIGFRTKVVKQSMKAKGLYNGGKVPYGKKLVNGVLENCAYEQKVIKITRKLRSEGKTVRECATVLAQKGYRTRNDRNIHFTSITRIAA
jgi:DNA invertase Pin-like site-specific DNA recombinase